MNMSVALSVSETGNAQRYPTNIDEARIRVSSSEPLNGDLLELLDSFALEGVDMQIETAIRDGANARSDVVTGLSFSHLAIGPTAVRVLAEWIHRRGVPSLRLERTAADGSKETLECSAAGMIQSDFAATVSELNRFIGPPGT
ncbi:MAG: hypothetical protein L0H73_16890 [Nitrococcus sp.]|nr:hypothetical protein [Nitrococcus sp.]